MDVLQMRVLFICVCMLCGFASASALANAEWPVVDKVSRQPLQASITRLIDALGAAGEPLPVEIRNQLEKLQDPYRPLPVRQ